LAVLFVDLRAGALLAVCLLAACGGGGVSSDGPTTGPPKPPPAANNPPILQNGNARQFAVHMHPFSYDPTQGGTTFRDPDGDPLTYTITLGHTYNPYNDPNPPAGLRVEGNRIAGAPEEITIVVVIITASDGRSSTTPDEFWIEVNPNSAPQVANANADRLISVGGFVDVDASKAGTALTDPDGDVLTYEISLRGVPRGLAVSGMRVTGVFDSIGAVEATVSARDAYGGVGKDVFLIAAPAPEPGEPNLPDPPYVYRDEDLDLPFLFASSSEDIIPLWDSTPPDNRTSNAGATLGRVLFYDKRMSITNTHACGSCHIQRLGFSAGERFSSGVLGVPTRRNAMALGNVRYSIHNSWFSDMRVHSLESLVLEPIQNPEELGSSLDRLVPKLQAAQFYAPLFEAAFGTPEINQDRITRALGQFLRSLISYRSRFDEAFNPPFNGPGDPASLLTPQEMRGFQIYDDDGRRRCNLCHELHGGANEWQANNGLDLVPSDPGVEDVALKQNSNTGVFRAAALRNIAVTGPYMHDGRFATLREVIDHYDHGVQDSPDLDTLLRDVLNTGLPWRLNLSEEDKDALEAFLQTMTDDEFLTDPKFSDPFE
jgi:cytochrome c peroxidase